MKKHFITLCLLIASCSVGKAQLNQDEIGAWYMYFWNTSFGETSFGLQGDIQYRNWNTFGDLEQLLIRGGFTYVPNYTDVKLTLGYGNITTGAYGESKETTAESRIYQEALIPQKIGRRIYLNHRFRYEQRWVQDQDIRTRYRYNLFINVPINNEVFKKNTLYLALYNELFVNGQRTIGEGRQVELFDRNRAYIALGYMLRPNLKMQLGFMNQTTENWRKDQLQISLHHKF